MSLIKQTLEDRLRVLAEARKIGTGCEESLILAQARQIGTLENLLCVALEALNDGYSGPEVVGMVFKTIESRIKAEVGQ